MQIKLAKCTDPPNKLHKTLSNNKTLTGTLKDVIDICEPVVLITTDPANYNYCYISQLRRYYFIKSYEVYRQGVFILHLKVDVLMTYQRYIENISGVLKRSSGGSPYASRTLVRDVREDSRRIDWNYTFSDESYILIAKGGLNNNGNV